MGGISPLPEESGEELFMMPGVLEGESSPLSHGGLPPEALESLEGNGG